MKNHFNSVSLFCAVSLFCVGAFSAGLPTAVYAQSPDQVIAKAYKSVRTNKKSAQDDVTTLITNLRTSHTMSEQAELIEALRVMGDVNGDSPPAIKAYLKEAVLPVLLEVLKSRSDGRVRGQALLALRSFDPSDNIIDEAITIARADTSADRDIVHQHGEVLNKWKEDRKTGTLVPEEKKAAVSAGRDKALAYLRKHKLEVNSHTLLKGVADTNPQLIEALADAGLEFDGVHAASAYSAIVAGLTSACQDNNGTPDKIEEIITLLTKRGFKMDTRDEYGNELVMSTLQACPAPVIARLVDLGATPNPLNKQNMRPLTFAFVAGQWDIAKILIDRGAGMTKQEVDMTFMELPEDPKKRELVDKALKNASQ